MGQKRRESASKRSPPARFSRLHDSKIKLRAFTFSIRSWLQRVNVRHYNPLRDSGGEGSIARTGQKTCMKTRKTKETARRLKRPQPRLSKSKPDRLVEEATVDCYNESEQATGLYTMIEDNLQSPFETESPRGYDNGYRVDITEDVQVNKKD